MEFLMMFQPIASALLTLTGMMLGFGTTALIVISIIRAATAHRKPPSVEEYEKLNEKDWENKDRMNAWELLLEKETVHRFFKPAKTIAITGLIGVLLLITPAHAKEIFKNRVVYEAVTSDTTAHAVKTLDKLLDTIDAKLDIAMKE
jgi:multisubunit Na+/H+ antiporter MnhC subunit